MQSVLLLICPVPVKILFTLVKNFLNQKPVPVLLALNLTVLDTAE
jgi:hypothetical protein